jgi:hypothetical protein
MEKWFNEVTLETNNIKLQPIKRTNKEDLINATNDGNLSNLWFTNIPTMNNIDSYITKAIEDFDLDKGLTFIVIDKKTNKVIGNYKIYQCNP